MRFEQSKPLQSNVLVLNRMFVAVHVLSARRAFCMLCKGVAEVVHIEDGIYNTYDFTGWLAASELKTEFGERRDHEDWIRSINFDVEVPRVIRVLRYDRIPKSVIKFNRRNVFLRDEHRCQYCGRVFGSHQLSLDHVLPRSRGGKSSWDNIVSACLKCNVRKGNRTPQEAGMKLYCKPKKPRRSPVMVQKINSEKYECWKNFIDAR